MKLATPSFTIIPPEIAGEYFLQFFFSVTSLPVGKIKIFAKIC